ERKAQALVVIAHTSQTILAPAIGARTGLIVGEVMPGVTIVAVVLTYRTPTGAHSGTGPTSSRESSAHEPRQVASLPRSSGTSLLWFRRVNQAWTYNGQGPAPAPSLELGGMAGAAPTGLRRKAGARSCPQDPARPTAERTSRQRGPPYAL